jgi:hypothetical protein
MPQTNITVAISLSYWRDDMINVIIEDMIDVSNGALICHFRSHQPNGMPHSFHILDLVRGRHHATHGSAEKLHEKGRPKIEKYLNIIKIGQFKIEHYLLLLLKS